MKTKVYGFAFALSVLFELYYNLIAVKQIVVYYDYTTFFLDNYITQPLLYCSLAALITELVRHFGWLHFPEKAQNVCLLLIVALLVLYVVSLIFLFVANTQFPFPVGLLIARYPQIFLVHGVLLALGLHKEISATNE